MIMTFGQRSRRVASGTIGRLLDLGMSELQVLAHINCFERLIERMHLEPDAPGHLLCIWSAHQLRQQAPRIEGLSKKDRALAAELIAATEEVKHAA